MYSFASELDFENELARLLEQNGWNNDSFANVLNNPSEQDLVDNFAKIVFVNNSESSKLNGVELSDSEIKQILENFKKSPCEIANMLKHGTLTIRRDNLSDTKNNGKEISLKIFSKDKIASGEIIYQIVRQPKFKKLNDMLKDRRGDLLLLINGLPLYHIELKKDDDKLDEAYYQLKKYKNEGLFSRGLMNLVQVFVVMTPNDSRYFANTNDDDFNKSFRFYWANENNEHLKNYVDLANSMLKIPLAHELVSKFSITENSRDNLIILRSYQYYAAKRILEVVKNHLGDFNLGGFIWHTTGSGKTMTSFKAAELVSELKNVDKVVFLVDRVELNDQSFKEYCSFSYDDSILNTYNTWDLKQKLSLKEREKLLITTIYKMQKLAESMSKDTKKIVFIVDEAHRSTSGDMLRVTKKVFTNSMFFGFTGTPTLDENSKFDNETKNIFGHELHRYTIKDGLKDENVLRFNLVQKINYDDVRDEKAKKLNDASWYDFDDEVVEKKLKETDFFENYEWKKNVAKDILDDFHRFSKSHKSHKFDRYFHAIFAVSSIPDAIEYYRIFKNEFKHDLKITTLFDTNLDISSAFTTHKEIALLEIISDYNAMFKKSFKADDVEFKKDIAARLAHKGHYIKIKDDEKLDMLIVVNQMLTGYDSKYVNTLYLDKTLEYANLIQAFSRTNRVLNELKPYGNIVYFKEPFAMQENIKKALKLYSGANESEVFVPKLGEYVETINKIYEKVQKLFPHGFLSLPSDEKEIKEFKRLFNELEWYIRAAKIQGYDFDKRSY